MNLAVLLVLGLSCIVFGVVMYLLGSTGRARAAKPFNTNENTAKVLATTPLNMRKNRNLNTHKKLMNRDR